MKRRLLIVGCARSGTGYTASLLGRLGVSIGHERIFGPPDGFSPGPELVAGHDVSWLAASELNRLDESWLILHQVRHPVLVARSTLAIELFDSRWWQIHHVRFWLNTKLGRPAGRSGPSYVTHAYKHARSISRERTPVDRAFRYWVEWNRLIESGPAETHRVEDIDASWLSNVFERLELDAPSNAEIDAALAQNPRNANHRGAGPAIELSDIKSQRLRSEVIDMADRYGYSVG